MKCPIFGLFSEAFAVSFGVPVSFLNLVVGCFFCLDDMYMYKYWTLDGFGKIYAKHLDVWCWVSFLDIGWYEHLDVDTHHGYWIIHWIHWME